MGLPVGSVTLPETVLFCASNCLVNNSIAMAITKNFLMTVLFVKKYYYTRKKETANVMDWMLSGLHFFKTTGFRVKL